MSDLQVSLLIIGAVVVGGVTAFNWFQQWRLRRRLEHAFDKRQDDLAMRQERAAESPQRVEPQLGSGHSAQARPEPMRVHEAPAPRASTSSPALAHDLPAVPGFDPALDFVASIDAGERISAAGLAELHTKAAACGRRFRVAGFNPQSDAWEEAGRLSGGRYAHLRLAVQLVSRKGVLDAAALGAVCDAVRDCANKFGASAHCPDIDSALNHASEVDAYCADVDVAIGVNVVAPAGGSFPGTRIRALAESAGFKLQPDGLFHYRDEAGHTLFTLDNQEPAPFIPEQMKQLNTSGITLVLDVPRVAEGSAALALMLRIGTHLAAGLGGTLVDDNKVALTDNGVRAIEQQLQAIRSKMEAGGMSPGSEQALRLFS